MTLEEPKKQIADDESEMMEVKHAWLTGYYIVEYEQHGADRAKYGTGLLKKLAARLNNSNFALPSLKNYRAFYKVYPEVGLEVAAYLRERFGKGYTACSLLVDAPTLALPDKSYTACSQSSPKRCSTAWQAHDATRRQSTCWDIALYGSR